MDASKIYILALVILGFIFALWFVVIFAGVKSEIAMMITGATISGFTIILQFFFRKKEGESDGK